MGQVAQLASIVLNAQTGDTIELLPGTYLLAGDTLQFAVPGVTLRSSTGDPDDVVIDGGYASGELINIYASLTTIADITLQKAYTHPIHVFGMLGTDVQETLIYNVRIFDPREQAIKINDYYGVYADDGEIACSHIELTDVGRPFVDNNCYTGGIDAHMAWGWTVRDNWIEGFWCDAGSPDFAIEFWEGSREPLIERNWIVDNARGLGLGMDIYSPRTYADAPCNGAVGISLYDGIARNNFIVTTRPEVYASAFGFDSGISMWHACGAMALHNTVVSTQAPFSSIEWRYADTSVTVTNNLVTHNLVARDSAAAALAGNLDYASTALFTDIYSPDLHLLSTATAAIDQGVPIAGGYADHDIDGELRDATPDIGADEYSLVLGDDDDDDTGDDDDDDDDTGDDDDDDDDTGDDDDDDDDTGDDDDDDDDTGDDDDDTAAFSTHSFSNNGGGSHPYAVTGSSSTFTVDLSVLPTDATIYRAHLVHDRGGNTGEYPESTWSYQDLQVEADDAPGVWLETVGPRHMQLDVTDAVQRAFNGNNPTRQVTLNVVSFAWFDFSDGVRVDVWCDQPAADPIAPITGMDVLFRDGDTMITFVEDPVYLADPAATVGDYAAAHATMDDVHEVRYRIYRHTVPIDEQTIHDAELVDEIEPMSAWNPQFYAFTWTGNTGDPCPRLPVDDGVIADVDTGIYVRRADASVAAAYYAVSRAVDGAEELTSFTDLANTNATGVAESVGNGMVLLREEVPYIGNDYQYEAFDSMYYYVRWEAPPTFNLPSQPADYLVVVPDDQVDPRPVALNLHEWGGRLDDTSMWWMEADAGALWVSTNQILVHWWSAFHDNLWTIRPFPDVDGNGGGVVDNYPQQRLNSFVDDFVASRWNIDEERVSLAGGSMGGSGTILWGVREPERFAWLHSWVGVAVPANSPTFTASFEEVYGDLSWSCEYDGTGQTAFDYWDSEQWILDDAARDMPLLVFSHGKNDAGIGWEQAWQFATALQAARQPHKWTWGQGGHSQRAVLPGEAQSDRTIGIELHADQTLPAFTSCAQDGDPGNGDPNVGDDSGHFNQYLLWEPDTSDDLNGHWEMTVFLIAASADTDTTVDVTPRRCQLFAPAPGTVCSWENWEQGSNVMVQSGSVTVDSDGLVTVPAASVTRGDIDRNRLIIDCP